MEPFQQLILISNVDSACFYNIENHVGPLILNSGLVKANALISGERPHQPMTAHLHVREGLLGTILPNKLRSSPGMSGIIWTSKPQTVSHAFLPSA